MKSLINPLSKLLRRWSNQQKSALHKLSEGRTVGQRLSGFGSSERMDAKFLLFAMVPFVPVMVADQIGWERGMLWHVWFWLSAAWAVIIGGIGIAPYWRVLRQYMRRK